MSGRKYFLVDRDGSNRGPLVAQEIAMLIEQDIISLDCELIDDSGRKILARDFEKIERYKGSLTGPMLLPPSSPSASSVMPNEDGVQIDEKVIRRRDGLICLVFAASCALLKFGCELGQPKPKPYTRPKTSRQRAIDHFKRKNRNEQIGR